MGTPIGVVEIHLQLEIATPVKVPLRAATPLALPWLCHCWEDLKQVRLLVFYRVVVAIKISNLLFCFCSFYLSCPILEKDNFIEFLYIVLSCLIK